MTKEQLQERLKTLEAESETLKSTYLGYLGAIQECKNWLAQLDTKTEG